MQLGTRSALPAELLAGRPSTPEPERGPIVCVCHGVGELAISAAASGGACTIDAIGVATRAGTNCGSCRPAVARLLAAALAPDLEPVE